MAPGPPVLSGNRFSLLDSELQSEPNGKKRKKNTQCDSNNPLQINTILPDPKFIVISSSDEKTPLSSVSIFLLKKAIDGISTSYESITTLRDGSLLILAKSTKIANLFLSKKNLANLCPIKVSLHSNLNSSKGTVYAPCLINVPEEEIVNEMKSQGVTAVYKFTKPTSTPRTTSQNTTSESDTTKDKYRATGLMLFSFDRFRPPTTVNIGWYNVKVEEHFPNPMRCRNCQILGHTAKRCNRLTSCVTCNLPPHQPNICTRTSCANCFEEHPASSKTCKAYLNAKEVLKIKTIQKCSMADAKKIFREQNPSLFSTTYSAVVQSATTTKKQISSTTPVPPPRQLSTHENPPIQSSLLTPQHNQVTQVQSTTTISHPINTFSSYSKNTVKSSTSPHSTQTSPSPQAISPGLPQYDHRSVPHHTTINNENHTQSSSISPPLPQTVENLQTLPHTQENLQTPMHICTSSSPLTNITNDLITKNKYYISNSDDETI